MLKTLRISAILEGISYLLLFTLSMPLKYWAGIGQPNIYIGYAHGFLFIAYLALALLVWKERSWPPKILVYLVLSSLLPFGTFYMESRFLRTI